SSAQSRRGPNLLLSFWKIPPPLRFPKWPVQILGRCIATHLQAGLIGRHERAFRAHDAGKDRALFKDCSELGVGGDCFRSDSRFALLGALAFADVARHL